MNRIENTFRALRKNRRKAFIAFITAGYPSLAVTRKLIPALEKSGVDIIELGVPFSDPMADGPIIQEASAMALEKKVTLQKILGVVKGIRKRTRIPICLMTYFNPIFCFGEERFAVEAVRSGVDGVIIPDLPPEEGREFIAHASGSGLDVIQFIAPTTSARRIGSIARIAKGFIYYVSLTGVTGPRKAVPAGLARQLAAIRRVTAKPVCVGFGVSNARQVRQLYRIADGVIVGSAIVRKIKERLHKKTLVQDVASFVSGLRG